MPQSYTTGGDSWANIKFQDVSAQNFRPQSTFILEWVDLWLDRALPFTQPYVEIFYCGADHKPWGDSLSHDRFVIASEALPGGIYHVRFSMAPLQLNEDDYYCLKLTWLPPIPFPTLQWRYDAGDATYPRGMRISSNDGGATWTIHYNDDHMFALWGTPPVPPPPPEPPINNVAILDLAELVTADGMQLTLTTNAPCHLYAAYTLHQPFKHPVPREQRGIALPDDTRWCFVDWTLNEQLEQGDTIIHTFTKEPWPVCETRYFCFRAKVDDEWIPAASPIFTIHRTAPPPPAIFYSDADPEVSSVDGGVARLPLMDTWAQIRNGPGTHAWPSSTVYYCRMRVSGGLPPTNWYEFARFICLWDMSVALGFTVVSAKVHIYGVRKEDTEGKNPAIGLFLSNPASDTDLIPADYQALGVAPMSDTIPYASFDPAGWNVLTINPAGIAIINGVLAGAGILRMGIREALYDAANIDPFVGKRNRIINFMWEDVDHPLGHKPYLEVVYS